MFNFATKSFFASVYRVTSGLIAFCGKQVSAISQTVISSAAVVSERVPKLQWVRWVMLAAIPSSLMLGVTTYFATDIASLPLLWVVPLALYLLSLHHCFFLLPALAT